MKGTQQAFSMRAVGSGARQESLAPGVRQESLSVSKHDHSTPRQSPRDSRAASPANAAQWTASPVYSRLNRQSVERTGRASTDSAMPLSEGSVRSSREGLPPPARPVPPLPSPRGSVPSPRDSTVAPAPSPRGGLSSLSASASALHSSQTRTTRRDGVASEAISDPHASRPSSRQDSSPRQDSSAKTRLSLIRSDGPAGGVGTGVGITFCKVHAQVGPYTIFAVAPGGRNVFHARHCLTTEIE